MKVTEWIGNICIWSSSGDIFSSLSSTKHQTHMEIIGNVSFQAFQVFVPGRYCVSSGHQSLDDQRFPSAVWVRDMPKSCTPPGETVGLGSLNPTPTSFLSDKLSLSGSQHPHAHFYPNLFSRRNLNCIISLNVRGEEGGNPSEIKIRK